MAETTTRKRHHMILQPDFSQNDTWREGKLGKFVRRKIPILKWLPRYKKKFIVSDLIAGITVFLTNIPASMGDAAIAGVNPEFGLYSAYVGAFIYAILGPTRELVIGPQAVLSLLSYQACGDQHSDCVILLGFYSGVVHLILGFLHLGFLVSFISQPVTTGFTAGAAVLIASGQLKNFLGIKGSASGTNVITIWEKIVGDFYTIRVWDSVLGILFVILLATLFKLKDLSHLRRWKKALHFLSLGRNALVMIIGMILGYTLVNNEDDDGPFKILGEVQGGFPKIQPPNFRLVDPNDLVSLNGTEGVEMSEMETLEYLGTSPLIIVFIAILQNVAIAKKFADGEQKIDATQEMISLGVINLVGSGFFQAIPSSASFSRSAVNGSSGVKSHFSGLLSGILVALSIAFIAPIFKFVPKTTIASIIIAAMIFMIDYRTIWKLWKFSKLEFLCCLLTFLVSILVGMDYGILAGVGSSIALIMVKALRPPIKTEYRNHLLSGLNYVFLGMDQGINFPSIDWINDQIIKKAFKMGSQTSRTVTTIENKIENQIEVRTVEEEIFSFNIIVLDCSMWTKFDYTSIMSMANLVNLLEKKGKILIFYYPPTAWLQLLTQFGLQNPIICHGDDELDVILMELAAAAAASSTASDGILQDERVLFVDDNGNEIESGDWTVESKKGQNI